MNKILTIQKSIEIAQNLKKQDRTIVVAGGFFDILHPGHIEFLEKSKKYGDYLFVLLEEDGNAKEKGEDRPTNSHKDRAKILASLQSVNYVIMLKNMTNNKRYDKLMVEIQPNVIATTFGDPHVEHKKRQAKLIQAKVIYVIKRINSHSTTKYMKEIDIDK
ncbi:MAG: adenylyltransferase/cytidyltransferase family protein [Candidatus Levybacteria bacterium]|nr:adenylyltransferase/cytidyltransferase family protein [Candidatus Levybacteria bacterium]MDZ4227700.1 adenylyltransferase/cytidyltransferase family protein [Candidatus Levybacteria bacterium]